MIKWINSKRNKKGFTLIELVVVIAILGILAAIAIPRFAGFQGSANAKSTLATLTAIDTAAQLVATNEGIELSAVTDAKIFAAMGWTAYPTNSPKGITYTTSSGVAQAAVAKDTAWPISTASALTGVTAAAIKAY